MTIQKPVTLEDIIPTLNFILYENKLFKRILTFTNKDDNGHVTPRDLTGITFSIELSSETDSVLLDIPLVVMGSTVTINLDPSVIPRNAIEITIFQTELGIKTPISRGSLTIKDM